MWDGKFLFVLWLSVHVNHFSVMSGSVTMGVVNYLIATEYFVFCSKQTKFFMFLKVVSGNVGPRKKEKDGLLMSQGKADNLDSVVDNALACHHCDPGSNCRVRIRVKACGRVVVARPGSVVFPGFSGFLHHIGHYAIICAFKNAYISSMSFLCN